MGYTLRNYQSDCVNAIDTDGAKGRHLVALATGLGKSVVFSQIKRRGRTLILSHRDELVRQPEKYYKGKCSFGIEKAEDHSNGEDVVSASVQTLSRDNRLKEFSPDDFYTIIIDECHHAASPTYKKVVNYFSGAKQILGFTATPKRGDGVRLTDVFDDILFVRDLRWGILNKWLSSVRTIRVHADYSLKGVRKVAGDFNQDALNSIMTEEVYAVAAKTYIQECHEKKRHTLIYCVSIIGCKCLLRIIRQMLPREDKKKVRMLTGQTPPEERAQLLKDFMDGDISCIINCMVLTEGTDLPICDTVINLRPTCNITLYTQMAGRSTRLYDGKDYSLLIDIVPDDERKLRNLCTAPTLFGVDPSKLEGKLLEKFNEGNDLLEVCDEVAGLAQASMDIVKKMQIIVEMDEAFLQGRVGIIMGDGSIEQRDFTKAAARFRDYMEEDLAGENDGLDFGELYVETLPDDSRRYMVRPDWNGRIFISKPDVLGNVTVDFHVSAPQMGYKDKLHFISDMPVHKAVSLVTKFCHTVPSYQWYCWNKTLRDNWGKLPATDRQKSKLSNSYRIFGFEKNGLDRLNKLDASNLIDLKAQMDEKNNEVKRLSAKKGCEKQEELFKKEAERQEADAKRGRERFPAFEKQLNSLYARTRDQIRVQQENMKGSGAGNMLERGIIELAVCIPPSGNSPASEKQESFLGGLYRQAVQKGYSFECGIPEEGLTKSGASVLISLLLFVKSNMPKTKGAFFANEEIKMVISDAGSGSGEIKVKFHISRDIVN